MDNLTTRGMSPVTPANESGDIPATPLKTILANAIYDGVESITVAGQVYDLRSSIEEAKTAVARYHWDGDCCDVCGSTTPNGACQWEAAQLIAEAHCR